jgi:hypothetical protein
MLYVVRVKALANTKLFKPWMTNWLVWKLSGFEKEEQSVQTACLQLLLTVYRYMKIEMSITHETDSEILFKCS